MRLDHEQDQDRAHPVVREALADFGQEQRRKAARMAEKLGLVDGGGERFAHRQAPRG